MIVALIISSIAALATVIGGVLATHPKMTTRPYLAMSLAFAAGAMLFVSFSGIKQSKAELARAEGRGRKKRRDEYEDEYEIKQRICTADECL